jgi:transposase-like protein
VSGNVAGTCRYYGISRQAFYKWLRRYEELGVEGLRDRSRRPHVSPNATRTEVVGRSCTSPELPLRAPQDRHVMRSRCPGTGVQVDVKVHRFALD